MTWSSLRKALARVRGKPAAGRGAAPEEGELARVGTTVLGESGAWNPDHVVRRKGFGYLRRMDDRNGFLYGLMRSRVEAVKRLGWEISPAADTPRDREIAAFVREALDRMEGSFYDDLTEILQAVKFGYSVLEIVWQPWEDSRHGERWAIRALRAKQQEQFEFLTDPYGNVTGLVQTTPVRQGLPAEKFVCAVFDPEPGNPYGRGLYSRLFWHDWFMREGWKFWAVAAERYGMPIVKMKVPRNAGAQTRAEARELLDSLQTSTGIVLPENMEIGLVEAVRGGNMTFGEFVNSQKEPIQIAILGQTLTSTVGERGSRALGEIHQQVRDEIIDSDAQWLYTVINEQVVRRLVDYNYAGVGAYPIVFPPPRDDEDLAALAGMLHDLSRLGMTLPKTWLHRKFGVPMPESIGAMPEGIDAPREEGESAVRT